MAEVTRPDYATLTEFVSYEAYCDNCGRQLISTNLEHWWHRENTFGGCVQESTFPKDANGQVIYRGDVIEWGGRRYEVRYLNQQTVGMSPDLWVYADAVRKVLGS